MLKEGNESDFKTALIESIFSSWLQSLQKWSICFLVRLPIMVGNKELWQQDELYVL
jgi:hypothetical protein